MEKPHFNVLYEPWIPVVDLDGNYFQLGIVDTLLRADRLREISDASPMVEFGLYRLLSVFLMDLYRPKTCGDLRRLLKQGKFLESDIQSYLEQCDRDGASFDLFDEKRPFLQTPYVKEWDKDPKPAAVINKTIPSGNNHTHFDHRKLNEIQFSYAEAARNLVPLQLFSTAGAQGYASGTNGAPPYFAIIRQKNLFSALVFAMLPEEKLPNHLRFDADSEKRVVPVSWRNDALVEPKREVAETSFLYGMLFPARRIQLIPDANTASVGQAYLAPGLNFKVVTNWTDPSVTYKRSDKGVSSLKPDAKDPIWKNLSTLINVPQKQAPLLLENAEDLDRYAMAFDVTLYGVQTNQASYIDTLKYDIRIPIGLLEDEEKIEAIKFNIQKATEIGKLIWSGFHERANGREFCAIPGLSSQSVEELLKRLSLREEELFWRISEQISQPDADLQEAQREWCSTIISWAKEEIRTMERSCQLRGNALGKLAKKEIIIFRKLNKIEEALHV